MSLGAYRPQVRNIFMFQGLTVGVIGTVAGLIAGYTISWAAGTYHLDRPRSAGVFRALRAVSIQRGRTEFGSPQRRWRSALPPL